ncbi:transketolase [Sphaerochaeta sp. PS]|uniref:transketolase n=1 Tax=Sphaerochaeta sp. PS TaxID=3076336 RepID=UPI0028A55845|nr:transketolase [Sphaerochaeta sp. PS]MDT4761095.1 transketolase [Sphaerochaeta sp. PS]
MDYKKLADAIRILSMDGVQKANSGHPGAPMGMADIAEVLFRRTMRYNPKNPSWRNRDRFVLSNGHASMLLYSLLHLTGYDVTLDDLKQFRQLGSITPGHPECHLTPGVETTTGPLGQGLANAVGMALAEKNLAATFNKKDFPIVDHYTYAFVGDGCLMEGISHEAASLAGTWKLNKLITFYDSNGISIDGEITNWFTDDTAQRFTSYGWHVISDVDGHDPHAITKAIARAKANIDQPTLIICKTVIGFGSPNKHGKASSHGSPLGEEEVTLARKQLGWKYDERFFVPEEMYEAWDFTEQGAAYEKEWNALFAEYKKQYPSEAAEFERRLEGTFPKGWEHKLDETIATWQADKLNVASRKASQLVLDTITQIMPELIGGSADLTPSNLTQGKGSVVYDIETGTGSYLHFGVREFGMMAILNGIALHGGFIAYGGTFLMFMEYAKNAIRMAAIMNLPVIQVFTHDSIGLGEDGPTHQAVEQAAILRMTPNMVVWRPADAVETAVAWKTALKRTDGPTSLLLSRQNLVPQERTAEQVQAVEKGGYILWESSKNPEVILIGTGSELELAMQAAKRLATEGKAVRVVSMPSCEMFEMQSDKYRESVIPSEVRKRVAVEAGWSDYWFKYVGLDGKIIGMHSFGASGPAEQLFEHFHITVEAVYEAARSLL